MFTFGGKQYNIEESAGAKIVQALTDTLAGLPQAFRDTQIAAMLDAAQKAMGKGQREVERAAKAQKLQALQGLQNALDNDPALVELRDTMLGQYREYVQAQAELNAMRQGLLAKILALAPSGVTPRVVVSEDYQTVKLAIPSTKAANGANGANGARGGSVAGRAVATGVRVTFNGDSQTFPTAKDAVNWLQSQGVEITLSVSPTGTPYYAKALDTNAKAHGYTVEKIYKS